MYRAIVIGAEGSIVKEAEAGEAGILPGHLVMISTTTDKAMLNTGAVLPVNIVEEDDMHGGGLETAYPLAEQLRYRVLKSGAEFYGLVGAATAAIAKGALLKPNTAKPGCWVTIGAGEEELARGRAKAALDNSAGAASARLLIEVL